MSEPEKKKPEPGWSWTIGWTLVVLLIGTLILLVIIGRYISNAA